MLRKGIAKKKESCSLKYVIYSGLCEGEKENGAGEKKMLAVVDFFLLFSLIPTFFQPQEFFFHWFLLLKL